jgi:hypothetical protein
MPETDLSSVVTRKLASILETCDLAEEKLRPYLAGAEEKPDLVPELFELLNSVDDLLEMVVTTTDTGHALGLPKSATSLCFSRILFTHLQNPDWDFTTWFREKVTNTKGGVKSLIAHCHEDQEVTGGNGEPDYVREGIEHSLEVIRAYTKGVFNEVLSDRLEIKEISAE